MNFRQLEYIKMIQKEGSISKAAAKLYISQSALSQQLLKLEDEIGAPIFERGFTPLRPTHFGELYLEYIHRILFEYREANHLLEEMEHNKRSRMTVGIPMNRSTQFLPEFLPPFMKDYPNIELVFREEPSWRLDQLVLSGDIDFSILTSATDDINLVFQPLVKEELYLAVEKDSELDRKFTAEGGAVDFRACADETFILMRKGHRLYNEAQALFREYNIRPKTILDTGNVDLARRLAAKGVGVCLASQLPAVLNPVSPSPSYHRIGKDGLFWVLGINYHKDKYISWAMRLFFKRVRDALEKHFPDEVITEKQLYFRVAE